MKIKSIAKKAVVPSLFKLGYYHWLLNRYTRDKAIILMYHNIRPSWKDRFEQQMRFISDHMQPIPLNELIDSLIGKKQFPPKSIAITFDDGYESVYNIAFSILREHRIPATVFLATGYVGTDKAFWWDEFRGMRKFSSHKEFRKKLGSVLKSQMPQMVFSNSKSFEVEVEKSLARLKDAQIIKIVSELRSELNPIETKERARILSWEQVKKMAQNGIDFASHTINHSNLITLSSKEIKEELRVSKEKIEEELNKSVSGFCYPIGLNEHYNEKVKGIVAKIGYRYACTAEIGYVSKGSDLFLLKRLSAGNEPSSYFVRDLALVLSENGG